MKEQRAEGRGVRCLSAGECERVLARRYARCYAQLYARVMVGHVNQPARYPQRHAYTLYGIVVNSVIRGAMKNAL